jgi:hypothetical protein
MITDFTTYKLIQMLIETENKLNEGLILTHDIHDAKHTLEHILSKYFFYDIEIKNNKINLILSEGFFIEKTYLEFLILINNLGFYIKTLKITNKQNRTNIFKPNDFKENYLDNNILQNFIKYEIILEPKYDIKHTLKTNILYHVTETKYLDRILKNGLIPKSKNTTGFYPERIYLVYNLDDANTYIKTKDNYYMLNIDKTKQPNKSKFQKIEYCILKITLPENNDLIFYEDPNFLNKGIYTYDNISKENIHPMVNGLIL